MQFTFTQRLNAMIDKLDGIRQDAERCDAGQTCNPGTRVRSVMSEIKDMAHQMRKDVISARNGGAPSEGGESSGEEG